jgi:hypothetical protein
VVRNTITSLHFVVRISVSIYARNPVRLQNAQNSGRLPLHKINCITSATFYIHYVLYRICITSIYCIPFAYFLLIPFISQIPSFGHITALLQNYRCNFLYFTHTPFHCKTQWPMFAKVPSSLVFAFFLKSFTFYL